MPGGFSDMNNMDAKALQSAKGIFSPGSLRANLYLLEASIQPIWISWIDTGT